MQSTERQAGLVVGLTRRERQVLAGMTAGLTNREIGNWLSIAESTVKGHAVRLFRDLEVLDRAEAAAIFSGRADDSPMPMPMPVPTPACPRLPDPAAVALLASLAPSRRQLAAALGVFQSRFTAEAVQALAERMGESPLAGELPGLIRAGVVRDEPQGRFALAPGIRPAVADLETPGFRARAEAAHAAVHAALAARIGRAATAPGMDAALAQERASRDDLIAAFRWSLAAGQADQAAATLRDLYRIWEAFGQDIALRRDIERLAAMATSVADAGLRANVIFVAAYQAYQFENLPLSFAWLQRLRREAPADPLFAALATTGAELLAGRREPGDLELHRVGEVLGERGHPIAWAPATLAANALAAQGDAERAASMLAAQAAAMEDAGNAFDRPVPLLNLAIVHAGGHRLGHARAVNRSLVTGCLDHGFDIALFRALMHRAVIDMRDDEPARLRTGVLLLGAVEAMSTRLGMPCGARWMDELGQARRQAQLRLGVAEVRRMHAAGGGLSADEAAALAAAR